MIKPKESEQIIRNLNDIKTEGLFGCLAKSIMWPCNSGGVLIVETLSKDIVIQTATDGVSYYKRLCWLSEWYDWAKI